MSLLGILEGAAGGFLAAKGEDKVDEWTGQPDHIECIHQDIHHVKQLLKDMSNYFRHELNTPIDTMITIPVAPAFLNLTTNGRKHTYLFFGSSTQIVLSVPGVGQISATFPLGWTELSLPDLTSVWVASGGNAANALYRTVNQTMGPNLL